MNTIISDQKQFNHEQINYKHSQYVGLDENENNGSNKLVLVLEQSTGNILSLSDKTEITLSQAETLWLLYLK